MQGLVVKNTGSDIWVQFADGNVQTCKIRGNFRIQGIKSTNPVVVGDIVEVDSNNQISDILPRKNHIARRPVNLSRRIHIIAANIDVALLVVTIKNPETSTVFIDRFIASAEAYGVPTILIFNKIDLLNHQETAQLNELIDIYQSIGYKCIKAVATSRQGILDIETEIEGKITLLSGNSGVGKSTLINSLTGENRAKTAEISTYHQKGMHTTTFSEMYGLNNRSYLIDTPGIKGFGVVDMDKDEISHYFVEIFATGRACRYPNCRHIQEPDCAVLHAVDEGKISASRYHSYLSMIEEVSGDDKYRGK
ncbi:GTPase RsgA [Porphyromonadaceae bacterium COT-184 OH4590]|nr:GTPase RsgA [Porphyromonadaceae bacterium COT-184 OH4590]MDO4726074.1 ribosome small subunit-dependent GTPase A [Porphyromonadaceae bacterium]